MVTGKLTVSSRLRDAEDASETVVQVQLLVRRHRTAAGRRPRCSVPPQPCVRWPCGVRLPPMNRGPAPPQVMQARAGRSRKRPDYRRTNPMHPGAGTPEGEGPAARGPVRSDRLDGHRHRAAATQAERRKTLAAAPTPQLVEAAWSSTRAPDAPIGWPRAMAPAVDVDPVPVEAQLVAIGEDLGRERLVDLDQVEVVRPCRPPSRAAGARR